MPWERDGRAKTGNQTWQSLKSELFLMKDNAQENIIFLQAMDNQHDAICWMFLICYLQKGNSQKKRGLGFFLLQAVDFQHDTICFPKQRQVFFKI